MRHPVKSERTESLPGLSPEERGVSPPVVGEDVLVRNAYGRFDRYRIVGVGATAPTHQHMDYPAVVEMPEYPRVSRMTCGYGHGLDQWHRDGEQP